jgi:predicted ATP-grasp superfamily ATP-dependent carboligase
VPLPPAVLLGGGANALSVARGLGRAGVRVYAINHPDEYVCHSRFATRLPVPFSGDIEGAWAKYLLGPESDWLHGAVVLACGDEGLTVLARQRKELLGKFRLDLSDPVAQLAALDKLATYRQAVAAGVPTPRFWVAGTPAQAAALRGELVYPLLVKPVLSHVYQRRFGRKFAVAGDFEELLKALREVGEAGIEAVLVELIPGPDDLLCSYYTYFDEMGNALFDFTKRVIRRYPPGMGLGCYHVTDWNPEARDLGRKLFRQVGLRGLANVEFKRDVRDGRLKLIEVNARFTAADCLVAASGCDLARFVYGRIVGLAPEPPRSYEVGKRLWHPLEDFRAFRQLRREGRLTLGAWLASLAHRTMLPYFCWDDPLPTVVHEWRRLQDLILTRLRRLDRFARRR